MAECERAEHATAFGWQRLQKAMRDQASQLRVYPAHYAAELLALTLKLGNAPLQAQRFYPGKDGHVLVDS
jgi:hypothetical protein